MAIRLRGARALLVRRPGRDAPGPDRAWAVLDQTGGGAVWGRWRAPEDLHAAAAVLAGPDPLPPTAEQALLVCTHGRHDTCCAVWGRPVAAALAARWPEQTWECSHLGGDRFAASLLVAPDGLYYGFLDPTSAVDVVAAHLRGTTGAAPLVQAALVAAHRELGPAPARALWPLELEAAGEQRWRVTLGDRDPLPAVVEVVLVRGRQAPARLTCGAAGLSAAATHTVESLTVRTAG